MPVQENGADLSKYKGRVRPCEFCKPEETLLGRSCQWCMSNHFLSECLNCKGSGKVTSGSVWDGGRSDYTAVCGICGGRGIFPAREADYARQQAAHPYANGTGNGSSSDRRSLPRATHPMSNLNITRRG